MFWPLKDGEEGNCRTAATTETTSCGFCGVCGSEREQFREDLSGIADSSAALWGSLSYKQANILSIMSCSLVDTVHSVFVVDTWFQHFKGKKKEEEKIRVHHINHKKVSVSTSRRKKVVYRKLWEIHVLKITQNFSVLMNQVPKEKNYCSDDA